MGQIQKIQRIWKGNRERQRENSKGDQKEGQQQGDKEEEEGRERDKEDIRGGMPKPPEIEGKRQPVHLWEPDERTLEDTRSRDEPREDEIGNKEDKDSKRIVIRQWVLEERRAEINKKREN